MVDSIARVRFNWDAGNTKCRAAALDAKDRVLGEISVELSEDSLRTIWAMRAGTAKLRIEEAAERYLRALLELRH